MPRNMISRHFQIRSLLRGTRGAIDLTAVIVGVLVVGFVSTIISATVFAAIPWAQDQATQRSLTQLRLAQEVANTRDGQYETVAQLNENGYLSTASKSTSRGSNSGPQLAGARLPMATLADASTNPPVNVPQVTLGPDQSCFVASQQSPTGRTYYVTSSQNGVFQVTSSLPDTSSCAPFPQPIGNAVVTVTNLSSSLVEKNSQNNSWTSSTTRNTTLYFLQTLTLSAQVSLVCPVGTTGSGGIQYNDGSGWTYLAKGNAQANAQPTNMTGTLKWTTALLTNLQFQTVLNCTGTTGPWSTSASGPSWSQPLSTDITQISVANPPQTGTNVKSTVSVVKNPTCAVGTMVSGSLLHTLNYDALINGATRTTTGAFPTLSTTLVFGSDNLQLTSAFTCSSPTSGVSTSVTDQVTGGSGTHVYNPVRNY